ncbi:MAG: asparaginase domain-containing protein [Campylobacterota bacterium]|nr:asparaginase domain-containing protein [Campylobacterota bacterium]
MEKKDEKEFLILNIGGTFNKVYNPISGNLDINKDNNIIKNIINKTKIKNIKIDGIIYKDSLDLTKKDRRYLVNYIKKSNYNDIIIVHGTDTINITAKYLNKYIKDKNIVLTGSMIPYSINGIEATSNLFLSYGFLLNCKKNNIYIAMHGIVKKFNKIKKNRVKGVFECL